MSRLYNFDWQYVLVGPGRQDSLHFRIYTVDLVLHALLTVGSGAHANGRTDTWCAQIMNHLVAFLDRRHHFVPISLYIGTVRVHLVV